MKRHQATVASAFAALLLVLLAGCRSGKSYRAERFDVDLQVHENGSATVTETVTFAFRGGPFTYAFREIPIARTDGIRNLTLSEDEARYGLGRQPGQYEVRTDSSQVRVTWHFTPTENIARTFVLSYEVDGLIRQEGPQDALRWGVIPPEHDYGVGEAQVVVRFPGQVKTLDGARVLEGHAQPGMLGSQVSFLASGIEPDEQLTIGVWFPHGQLSGVPPAWQQRQAAQAARGKLWVALAVLLLAGGLLGSIWAWRRYGREPAPATIGTLPSPPGDLPPGLAGALVHNGATLADALATVFDLGRRGVLAVEETEPRDLLRRVPGFAVRLLALPGDLQLFEVATLQVAFLKAAAKGARPSRAQRAAALLPGQPALGQLLAANQAVGLSDLAGALQANWQGLARLYNAALYEQKLFGPERDRVRRGLIVGGVAGLLLALLTIAVPLTWEALFGPWPLLVSGALLLASVALLLAGSATARRTAAGEQAAGEWRAFRAHLRQMARRHPQADQAEQYESYLTYATAFGLETRWAKQMSQSGAALPSWFRTLSQEVEAQQRWATFGAWIAATSATSHGGAGAGAAGGAAGGGASGAG